MASQAISEQPTVISAELRKELRQELRDAGVLSACRCGLGSNFWSC